MSSSASINSNELVKQQWVALCDRLNIKDDEEKIWSVIAARYSESARHYHTMNHIADLFEKKSSMNLKINDSIVFNLAIIFHDIVYDPASSTNEEDSVKLFQELCAEHIPKEIADKTSEYIIATKSHNVADSPDKDLQLFIDLDMSILCSEMSRYREYAAEIRREYISVPRSEYLERRGKFLRHSLTSEHFSATSEFRALDAQARSNIEWEINEFNNSRIPGEL